MRSAAARAELPVICPIHQKDFVRFGNGKEYSFGCPVCVFIIREQVRALRAGAKAFRKKPVRCEADDTGSGKRG